MASSLGRPCRLTVALRKAGRAVILPRLRWLLLCVTLTPALSPACSDEDPPLEGVEAPPDAGPFFMLAIRVSQAGLEPGGVVLLNGEALVVSSTEPSLAQRWLRYDSYEQALATRLELQIDVDGSQVYAHDVPVDFCTRLCSQDGACAWGTTLSRETIGFQVIDGRALLGPTDAVCEGDGGTLGFGH